MIKEQGLTPSKRRDCALSVLTNLKGDIKQRVSDCLATTDLNDPVDIASTMVYIEVMDSFLDHADFLEGFYANK